MREGKRQGGSVGVFVIVGIILAVIAFGTLYGMRRVAMNDQTPPMAIDEADSNGETEQNGSDAGESTDDGSAAQDENGSGDASQDGSTDAPITSQGDQDNQGTSDGASGGIGQDGSGTTGGTSGAGTTDASEFGGALPQSGPAESMSAVALALIAAASTAYIVSLRKV